MATQHAPPSAASVQLLLSEVDGTTSTSSTSRATGWWGRRTRKQRDIIVVVSVLLIIAVIVVIVLLTLEATHSFATPPPVHVPPYNPSNNNNGGRGGGPRGPGTGNGCSAWVKDYPEAPCFMPPGCPKLLNPVGPRYEWNKLDIGSSQPTYPGGSKAMPACGGSCGGASGGYHSGSVLICAPGPIINDDAPYQLRNPYGQPVSVVSLNFNTKSYDWETTTTNDFGACYWNTDFDASGNLLPNAQPATIPANATVNLSLGFDKAQTGEDADTVVTQNTSGENAALGFIFPQCSNHGIFWKQISGAYPPCQAGATTRSQLKRFKDSLNPFLGGKHSHGTVCSCAQAVGHQQGCISYWNLGSVINPSTQPYFPSSDTPLIADPTVGFNADGTSAIVVPPRFSPMAPQTALMEPQAWIPMPPTKKKGENFFTKVPPHYQIPAYPQCSQAADTK